MPGTHVVRPMTRVEDAIAGPALLLTAGVHSGEHAPIETAIRFASAVQPERINGRALIVHLTNPPFFAESQLWFPKAEKI